MAAKWNDWALLPLRLILGIGFIYHGFPKLFTAEDHRGFVGMLQGMGVPFPELTAWFVGIVEFLGGIALIIGAFVTIVSILLAIDMLVAAFTVHLPYGFSLLNIKEMTQAGPVFGMPGYEVNLLYIAGLVTLILGGSGHLSIAPMRRGRRMRA